MTPTQALEILQYRHVLLGFICLPVPERPPCLLLLSEFPEHESVVEMPGHKCRKN